MLIGLLASSYHRLALAKDLMSRGAAEQEVFRVVNMPFNQRKEFLATARRADSNELARRINASPRQTSPSRPRSAAAATEARASNSKCSSANSPHKCSDGT